MKFKVGTAQGIRGANINHRHQNADILNKDVNVSIVAVVSCCILTVCVSSASQGQRGNTSVGHNLCLLRFQIQLLHFLSEGLHSYTVEIYQIESVCCIFCIKFAFKSEIGCCI